MKQHYTLIFLFFGMLFSNFSFGQAPIANPVTFEVFASDCNTPFMSLVSNGSVTNSGGGIDWSTVDIDQSQPGIQSQFNANPQGTFQVSNGSFYFMAFPFPGAFPIQNVNVTYTVQDLSGNTSNIGTITFIIHRLATYTSIITQPTCEDVNSGTIAIHNVSAVGGQCTLKLYRESDPPVSYPLFPGQPFDLVIQGLTFGNYAYEIINDNCGVVAEYFHPAGYLTIENPLYATGTGTYQDYNNDGIVNVGDIVNYHFSVTNNSPTCTMNDVAVYYLITPTGGPIANLAPLATDSTTLTGYAPITQEHINSGLVHSPTNMGVSNPGINPFSIPIDVPLNISDGIKCNAFIDTNSNSVQDNGELNYTEGTFSYQINAGETHNVITSTGMHYLYETNPANSYTLQYNINPNNSYCGTQYTVATSSYTGITVANGSGIVTYNFAITIVPCTDIAVNLNSYWSRPRPGFTYTNTINFKNEGNQNIPNGTLTFTKDNAVTIAAVSDSGYVNNANGFTLNFYNLNPGESRSVTVTIQVPVIPTVSLGQLLTNSVSITPTDANTLNNSASIDQNIVGSFDPNEKTESHGGRILHAAFTANDYLTYTIRFENTGTAEAINIRVNDILDPKLDETSIKMIATSHAYVLDRMGTNLNWRFDGINLPPSVSGDEVTGHGYIVFKIKPKPGFALGDIIPNTADIFFDFNPAIVTNTCTTQFVATLGLNAFDAGTFECYPNPTSDMVTFAFKNTSTTIDTIEVMDVLGKSLLSKTINHNDATIDLSSLEKGIYLVKLKANGQTKTIKISKK